MCLWMESSWGPCEVRTPGGSPQTRGEGVKNSSSPPRSGRKPGENQSAQEQNNNVWVLVLPEWERKSIQELLNMEEQWNTIAMEETEKWCWNGDAQDVAKQ